MDGLSVLHRPLRLLFSRRAQSLHSLPTTARRHQSSYRRTKQRLNVKPDASFTFSKNSPQEDHIIFNPPSSAPSVLHTPLKFLPKDDKRRSLFLSSSSSPFQASASTSPSTNNLPLPPLLRPNKVPHNHLSEADIAEIRRLHQSDQEQWTNARLARKFNCSTLFVTILLKHSGIKPNDNAERRRKATEEVMARWGERRRMAREERKRRLEMALRDE